MSLVKIVSGAQTGADRAGLDAALHLGLEVGGWIPKGRRTDEGPLSEADFLRYHLREHASPYYPGRTMQNVMDANATVLFGDMTSPGCKLTLKYCSDYRKPFCCLRKEDFVRGNTALMVREFVKNHGIQVLNVAGNRERTNKGIYQTTFDTLIEAFAPLVYCDQCKRELRPHLRCIC